MRHQATRAPLVQPAIRPVQDMHAVACVQLSYFKIILKCHPSTSCAAAWLLA